MGTIDINFIGSVVVDYSPMYPGERRYKLLLSSVLCC